VNNEFFYQADSALSLTVLVLATLIVSAIGIFNLCQGRHTVRPSDLEF
jgi:hypothetical protein